MRRQNQMRRKKVNAFINTFEAQLTLNTSINAICTSH